MHKNMPLTKKNSVNNNNVSSKGHKKKFRILYGLRREMLIQKNYTFLCILY